MPSLTAIRSAPRCSAPRINVRAHMHTGRRACTRTLARTHARTHACTHARTLARTHARTHARTCTLAKHTLPLPQLGAMYRVGQFGSFTREGGHSSSSTSLTLDVLCPQLGCKCVVTVGPRPKVQGLRCLSPPQLTPDAAAPSRQQ